MDSRIPVLFNGLVRSRHYLFSRSSCTRFGLWEPLKAGFFVLLTFFFFLSFSEYFLVFWHKKVFQGHRLPFLAQPRN